MRRVDLVDVALGHKPADLVIKNGKLVNVATAEVYPAAVAIKGNRIAAVGDVDYTIGENTTVIDAAGRYLTPGLIEAHMHGYHTFIGIPQFAEAMILKGTTTYVDAFYGPGIVAGKEAVRFFKDAFNNTPLRNLFLVPTIAYIQNRDTGLTPAEGVSAADMMEMLDWPDCYGLEEPPPLPLLERWPEIVELTEKTLSKRMVIGGHAAALDPRSLQAYTAMGVTNDHEAITTSEALERARAGYGVFMRMARAHVFGVQSALEVMRPGGSIILTGSVMSTRGWPGHTAYSASKAAIRSIARTWAQELKDRSIRVNVISPGAIHTPLLVDAGADPVVFPHVYEEVTKTLPLGRYGQPSEIAKAALFLASAEASYVTGAELCIDGGLCQI